jgi:hypothetical protein
MSHGNKTKYLIESCAKKDSGRGLWSPLAEREWMFAYQLRDKRRISAETIKREIQGWEAAVFPTPPSSVRGKKRKLVPDDEEEDGEEEEDQRNISAEGKWYTRKLHHSLKSNFDSKIGHCWTSSMNTATKRIMGRGTPGTKYDIA